MIKDQDGESVVRADAWRLSSPIVRPLRGGVLEEFPLWWVALGLARAPRWVPCLHPAGPRQHGQSQ